ncbi:hypothetical protein [Leptospira santarosai]|uniref:Uncharacterized protein n=1 Tax=Leptospira santarosai serovar Shermani str. LT 821 TaxID=758847 RepID=K8Y475_9LEPT|nr:hypothetical protein [Leptospira santarosai]EKT87796.1 hypothetical protein LSS_05508 [Leptospira santarosai serovar Shermani str. LT 821]EPG84367.1 hypothetical protein LEP1GSC048_3427 [Leptospira santarosai serovar Shermani str. 1342KT]MDI7202195.1 hypothetical protein [Leptospira santarosai]MDI7229224.1 hypothetical protein [Leptospira santarosai]
MKILKQEEEKGGLTPPFFVYRKSGLLGIAVRLFQSFTLKSKLAGIPTNYVPSGD